MDKKRIIAIVISVLLIGGIAFKIYSDNKNGEDKKMLVEEKIATADEKKFKEEYESLNGSIVFDETKYIELNIKEFNKVVYKNDTEIVDILNNGTGVVYFGFNSCPWCRSMIEVLLEVIEDGEVTNFYYTDIKSVRSQYKVVNNKLNKTTEGTESYYKILEKLDAYLSDYIITDNKKEYNTKEKRLYAPTVVVFKDGEILGFHEVTVDSQTDPFAGLNSTQSDELYNIYASMVNKLKDITCNDKAGC